MKNNELGTTFHEAQVNTEEGSSVVYVKPYVIAQYTYIYIYFGLWKSKLLIMCKNKRKIIKQSQFFASKKYIHITYAFINSVGLKPNLEDFL